MYFKAHQLDSTVGQVTKMLDRSSCMWWTNIGSTGVTLLGQQLGKCHFLCYPNVGATNQHWPNLRPKLPINMVGSRLAQHYQPAFALRFAYIRATNLAAKTTFGLTFRKLGQGKFVIQLTTYCDLQFSNQVNLSVYIHGASTQITMMW